MAAVRPVGALGGNHAADVARFYDTFATFFGYDLVRSAGAGSTSAGEGIRTPVRGFVCKEGLESGENCWVNRGLVVINCYHTDDREGCLDMVPQNLGLLIEISVRK